MGRTKKIRPETLAPGIVPTCPKCRTQQPQRQRFAFTPVLLTEEEIKKVCAQKGAMPPPPGAFWIIGRADEGTPGYTPLLVCGIFDTEKQARKQSDELNKFSGLPKDVAAMIVLSTMRMMKE